MYSSPTPSALENASRLASAVCRPCRACLPIARILSSGVAVALLATGLLILTAPGA